MVTSRFIFHAAVLSVDPPNQVQPSLHRFVGRPDVPRAAVQLEPGGTQHLPDPTMTGFRARSLSMAPPRSGARGKRIITSSTVNITNEPRGRKLPTRSAHVFPHATWSGVGQVPPDAAIKQRPV